MPRKDPDNLDIRDMNLNELVELRRTLAKRANQRIVRIEQAGISAKSTSVENYALKYLRRVGRNRFSERKTPLPGDRLVDIMNKERAEIANLERFLQSKTSTVGGVKQVRAKTAKTFKQRYNIDLSKKQIENIMTDYFKFLVHSVGSPVAIAIVKAAGQSQAAFNEVMDKLEKLKDDNEDLTDMSAEEVFSKLDLKFDPDYLLKQSAPNNNPFRN